MKIQLNFNDFDDYWSSQAGETVHNMDHAHMGRFKAVLLERLTPGEDGRITYGARVHVIRGHMAA